MAQTNLSKDSRIAIIGASAFGLSTALHLAARGFKDITIFDKRSQSDLQALSTPKHTYAAIRSDPAGQRDGYDLSSEAIAGWNAWNTELWGGATVPPGMGPEDRLFINNGYFHFFNGAAIPEADMARLNPKGPKWRHLALLLSTDLDHVDSANSRMFNIDPFGREAKGKPNTGLLDTLGGTVALEAAYRFALHKAQTLGVKFVTDPERGTVEDIGYREPGGDNLKVVTGVRTKDSKTHDAGFVVWACRTPHPYVPSPLGPTTTGGSETVGALRIPAGGELWDRFGPDNSPTWEHRLPNGQGAVIFGFPRDDNGHMIVGIRAEAECDTDGKDAATDHIKTFLAENLPEFKEAGIDFDRLSISSSWSAGRRIIDRVPGVKNLVLAADGRKSGEGLTLLPSIGSHVVDVLEGGASALKSWRLNPEVTGKPAIHPEKESRKAKL